MPLRGLFVGLILLSFIQISDQDNSADAWEELLTPLDDDHNNLNKVQLSQVIAPNGGALPGEDVLHLGEDCSKACGGKRGLCQFCGFYGACCRSNTGGTSGFHGDACNGQNGGLTSYECSRRADTPAAPTATVEKEERPWYSLWPPGEKAIDPQAADHAKLEKLQQTASLACGQTHNGPAKAAGAGCSFPFTYKGNVYEECISLSQNVFSRGVTANPWCATTQLYDSNHWGLCSEKCVQAQKALLALKRPFVFAQQALFDSFNQGLPYTGTLMKHQDLEIITADLEIHTVGLAVTPSNSADYKGATELDIQVEIDFKQVDIKNIPYQAQRTMDVEVSSACRSKNSKIRIDVSVMVTYKTHS